jgi:hypothetical protein
LARGVLSTAIETRGVNLLQSSHREHILIGAHPYFTFVPSHLRCNACGLELDGRDELDAAGVGEPWLLEDVDRATSSEVMGEW